MIPKLVLKTLDDLHIDASSANGIDQGGYICRLSIPSSNKYGSGAKFMLGEVSTLG
jgi:hypothetical protein